MPTAAIAAAITAGQFTTNGKSGSPLKGWRLEQTANGYYRWRWQKQPVIIDGKTVYPRGSKYLPVSMGRALANKRGANGQE